eukprot:COSAG05_NODE_1211_length_5498_cov_120.273014_4_plen_142_part_00
MAGGSSVDAYTIYRVSRYLAARAGDIWSWRWRPLPCPHRMASGLSLPQKSMMLTLRSSARRFDTVPDGRPDGRLKTNIHVVSRASKTESIAIQDKKYESSCKVWVCLELSVTPPPPGYCTPLGYLLNDAPGSPYVRNWSVY